MKSYLEGRENRKKMLTDKISSDMIDTYQERILEGTTTFDKFFLSVDPAYKASFHNEVINVWGFNRNQSLQESFFVDLLSHVQETNNRSGF